jgi:short-subunit dehydrogenase
VTTGVTYAVITGASKGLGKYFARALAARKQNLILVARSKDKLEALANELRNTHGVLAESLEMDLAAAGAGLQLAQKLREQNFQTELLVNNAGFGKRGEFLQLSLEHQLQMIHLHDTVVVELTYQLLPAMVERGQGGIINVSSMAGFQPVPYAAMYSATKSFLTTFSMALREELRTSGVKVVTVCPGRLRADTEDAEAQENRQKVPGGEQRHEVVVDETLKKLDAGGGLVIPGRINRLTVRGQRLMSLNAVPKIVARLSRS